MRHDQFEEWITSLVSEVRRIHRLLADSVSPGIEVARAERAEDDLCGQALALFRLLSRHRRKLSFDEVAKLSDAFRNPYPKHETIRRALERLSVQLADHGFHVRLSRGTAILVDLTDKIPDKLTGVHSETSQEQSDHSIGDSRHEC